jgi:hypothetical protein
VYFRVSDGEKVMVILNNGVEKKGFSLNQYKEILSGHKSGTDILSKTNFDLTKSIDFESKNTIYIFHKISNWCIRVFVY